MKELIIAEKPNMGKFIAKVLGIENVPKQKYLENERYIVTWAYGHLIELKSPAEHDEKWEKWSVDTLPIFPQEFQHKVIDNPLSKTQFRVIRDLIHRPDVSRIINAGDDGREGEYIQQLIYNMAKNTKPVVRLCVDSQTESKVKSAIQNLKSGAEYEKYNRMYTAGYCRECEDYVVGMTFSRLINCEYNTVGQSIGRVQTIIVSMIQKRDGQIKNFVPVPYWNVQIDTGDFTAIYFKDKDNKETAIMEKPDAEKIAQSAKGQSGKIIHISKEEKTQSRPQLYRLNTLQADASNKFGYTAEQVLEIVQSLYDSHKIVTYPRTESSYINNADAEEYPSLIADIKDKIPSFQDVIIDVERSGLRLDKKVVDESKIADHGAIIINSNFRDYNLGRLSEDDKKILNMILIRMVLAVSPDRKYNKSELVFQTQDGNCFFATGTETTFAGWKGYEKILVGKKVESDKEQNFDSLREGMTYSVQDAVINDKQTNPPKPFTESTLITAMENISSIIDNEELKKVMKARGIGTSATRSATIQKVVDRGYISRTQKNKTSAPILHITDLGEQIVKSAPVELTDPQWGAEWEEKLQMIENGEYSQARFMEELKEYIYSAVRNYQHKDNVSFPQKDDLSSRLLGKCPKCGSDFITGKFGGYCSNRCGFSCNQAYGKKLTEKQISGLLKREKILLKGLKSKKGTTYDAYITPTDIVERKYGDKTYYEFEYNMEFPKNGTGRKKKAITNQYKTYMQ